MTNSSITDNATAEQLGAVAKALIADMQAIQRQIQVIDNELSRLRAAPGARELLARVGIGKVRVASAPAIAKAEGDRALLQVALDDAIAAAKEATHAWTVQTACDAEAAHNQALTMCVRALAHYREAYFAALDCMPPTPNLEQLVTELERSAGISTWATAT